jgi:hypothetical protein
VVAERTINWGHWIQLEDSSILAKKTRQVDWILREIIEVRLHANNMNRDSGISPSCAWNLLIHDLKEWGHSLTKELVLFHGL